MKKKTTTSIFVSNLSKIVLLLLFVSIGCSNNNDHIDKIETAKSKEATKPIDPSDELMIWKILDTTTLMANYVLDLEKMHKFESTEKHLSFVENFIHSWKPPIKAKPNYSKKEAIEILNSIHNYIKDQDYKLKDYHPTLNMSITYKYFDCDVLSILYKTLAEQYQLPLQCIYSPQHLSILWKDTKNEIFWETTSGKEVSKEYYLKKYRLKEAKALEIGILRPLNRKEMAAIVLHNVARAKFSKKENDAALRTVYQALKMFPDLPENHLLLGRIFTKKKDYNKAELSYQMYVDEIPHHAAAQKELSKVFAKLGCVQPYVCCQGEGDDDPTNAIAPE